MYERVHIWLIRFKLFKDGTPEEGVSLFVHFSQQHL